jgi:hypothetical protein
MALLYHNLGIVAIVVIGMALAVTPIMQQIGFAP